MSNPGAPATPEKLPASPKQTSKPSESTTRIHSVDTAAGDLLAVNLLSADGFRCDQGAPEEWFAALDHFRTTKAIASQNDSLANAVARVASMWAKEVAWVKSVFVLLGNANDANAALTLLISVDDSKAENSWACSKFALLVGGHSGHAVQTCIVEEDVPPQAGYIHSYIRPDAKPQTTH